MKRARNSSVLFAFAEVESSCYGLKIGERGVKETLSKRELGTLPMIYFVFEK